jgi:23S rRNA (guanosine2251-2'-O)-methyltransferase
MGMQLVVIAHNIRSTYNVGAILRTCDAFGIERLHATGYTPYPNLPGDTRPPHVRGKLTRQIHKTALGAESTVPCSYTEDAAGAIATYHTAGYRIVALEQSPRATMLPSYLPPAKLALLLGEERFGITPELLALCDDVIEIPMIGHKESFNVSVAAGIALYALTQKL